MDTFVTMSEASRRVGSSRNSIRRRVNRGEIPVFADPLDDRRRLVRVADVDRLREPRPIRPAPIGPGDAAA